MAMAHQPKDIDLCDEDIVFFAQNPQYLCYIHSQDGLTVPSWFIEVRNQNLGIQKIRKVLKPTCRACDDKQWIKRDNRHFGGIRKQRRPEAPAPARKSMARPLTKAQYEHHHLHLLNCVLGLRMNASPFTLVLDDLNQTAAPLVQEFVFRAFSRNLNVVYISFESSRAVHHSRIRHIPVMGYHTGDQILDVLENALRDHKESLVIIDSVYDIVVDKSIDMSELYNLVAMQHCSTMVGVYHQNIIPSINPANPYAPEPLDVLKFMATTIITCKSFAHVLAAKAAAERSLPEPSHGLLQGAEGIIQCLDANDSRGIVLEAEFRRKSGRTESERYFLRASRRSDYHEPLAMQVVGTLKKEFVKLLDQVPAYASKEVSGLINAAANEGLAAGEMESTFKLGLTEKQRAAREGVVLPYFDAQKNMGDAGEGGRILYDMGSEDDFDEEEDEI